MSESQAKFCPPDHSASREFKGDERFLVYPVVLGMNIFLVVVSGLEPPGEFPLWQRVVYGTTVSLVVTFAGSLWMRLRVFVGPTEAVLVNQFFTFHIPYDLIRHVSVDEGLVVELEDGRRVKGRAIPETPLGSVIGYRTAEKVREAIQAQASQHPSTTSAPHLQRTLYIPWKLTTFVVILHLSWGAILAAYGVA